MLHSRTTCTHKVRFTQGLSVLSRSCCTQGLPVLTRSGSPKDYLCSQGHAALNEVDKSIFSCKHNVILAAIYKPPNVNIDIFNKHLEKMLVAIQKERKYAFLIGDYNINTMDELRCKSTLTNEFINLMSLYSY